MLVRKADTYATYTRLAATVKCFAEQNIDDAGGCAKHKTEVYHSGAVNIYCIRSIAKQRFKKHVRMERKRTLSRLTLFSFEGTIPQIHPVMMARRIHLFPCRTQKLSSLASMILGGRLPGKVERCRFKKH